jgi:hypothetical protein
VRSSSHIFLRSPPKYPSHLSGEKSGLSFGVVAVSLAITFNQKVSFGDERVFAATGREKGKYLRSLASKQRAA